MQLAHVQWCSGADAALDHNATGKPSVMSGIEEVIEVEAPAARAYALWADFGRFSEFVDNVESVERTGDRLHWTAKVGPKTNEWDAEIVAEEPGRRIAWKAPDGPIDTDITFEEKTPGTTTVTFREHMHDSLAAQAAAMTPFADRQARKDLERYKALVEAGG
jgi:uncharacterized membrane protein